MFFHPATPHTFRIKRKLYFHSEPQPGQDPVPESPYDFLSGSLSSTFLTPASLVHEAFEVAGFVVGSSQAFRVDPPPLSICSNSPLGLAVA